MAVVVAGISHRTVPLPVLERVAFGPSDLPKAVSRVLDFDPIHEAVILSTCNRTEIYAMVHRFHPAVQAVRRFLSDASGVSQEEISSGLYTYYDASAARHLFSVASGVDSMVVGEPQILGQVREAFKAAQEEGAARRTLSALFQSALRVGKRARTNTAISRHVVSLPQAAARMSSDLTGGLRDKHVVVVGAGRMGELAARALEDLGADTLTIANRTPDRARALAARVGASVASFEELASLLGTADVIVSATASTSPVLDRAAIESGVAGRDTPLVAVDLGMPRDLDPSARTLENVVLRDIDDLHAVVEEGASKRRAEVPKVEAIVGEEVERFCAWERSLALGPSITQLREWAETVRAREVKRAAKSLDAGELEALDRATRQLVNKILHRPITRMKELAGDADGQVYLETFQEIFDLGTDD